MILKPDWNYRNKITTTGVLAVPILRNRFNIIDVDFKKHTKKKKNKSTEKLEICKQCIEWVTRMVT
jgi:hypothetical protein